ncbi:hypothetical protein A7U60_g6932 [Sanghuangporus baumii]|uniref:Zinc finger Mcm10/DnaG-type domain-containing protein n=1 Tax=Sanghuangporus baumii TaxID=108892 RepID=A0A9Q5HU77_SANBA|nr:hypothetical protein A7U60_g6932 [Sanghuangporus baumii]
MCGTTNSVFIHHACIFMASREEIKRQIEALRAKLAEAPQTPPAKRRRSEQSNLLAPATPSPRKKSAARQGSHSPSRGAPSHLQTRHHPVRDGVQKGKLAPSACPKHPGPAPASEKSLFISQLKTLNTRENAVREVLTRTEGFEERPAAPTASEDAKVPARDDRLAIIEDLVPGPVEHKPIPNDPDFNKIEPNSGIRLKERILSHASLQDHLFGRYYLSPSLLYSVVRLQANKQAYEVAVEGDWVTIAVVAERGDVKLTSGPGNLAYNKRQNEANEDDLGKDNSRKSKRKKDADEEDEDTARKGAKKYVHLRLVDLGHRSRTWGSSSDSFRGSLRGDAQLSLLLFESDYYDKLIDKNGNKEKIRKIWRGGSGGAFEECFPGLREGTVIALLNPKVLKPFTNSKNPSSTSSILALTPPSSSAIAIIGIASDLGRCTVIKRDGKPCGSWVDRRISHGASNSKPTGDVCEYHTQAAVLRTRAARPEFSIGTSGLSTTAHKRKAEYDPAQQWGLKPDPVSRGMDGETTFVVGGFVASSGRAQTLGNVGNTMGREEQARARRKAGTKEDKILAELLGKSTSHSAGVGGGEASREALTVVQKARQAVTKARCDSKAAVVGSQTAAPAGEENGDNAEPQCKAYSAELIRRLGFDPTIKAYGVRKPGVKPKTADGTSKLGKLASQNRDIQLGPPPGPKVRSGVAVSHLRNNPDAASPTESSLPLQQGGAGDHTVAADSICLPTSSVNKLERSELVRKRVPSVSTAESDTESDLEIEPASPSTETEEMMGIALTCV